MIRVTFVLDAATDQRGSKDVILEFVAVFSEPFPPLGNLREILFQELELFSLLCVKVLEFPGYPFSLLSGLKTTLVYVA